jgi:hypothetical protein
MLIGLAEGAWWALRAGSQRTDMNERVKEAEDYEGNAVPQDVVEREEGKAGQRGLRGWEVMAERMGMEHESGPSRPRAFKVRWLLHNPLSRLS